jgi:hypothetical protein
MFLYCDSGTREKKNWKSLPYCPRKGHRFFSSSNCPDRLWGLPSLLLNGFQGPFPNLMRSGHNLNHSPPSSAVTNEWNYTAAPPTYPHGINRYNFTFFNPITEYLVPLCLQSAAVSKLRRQKQRLQRFQLSLWNIPLLFGQGCEICNLQH